MFFFPVQTFFLLLSRNNPLFFLPLRQRNKHIPPITPLFLLVCAQTFLFFSLLNKIFFHHFLLNNLFFQTEP